MIIIAGDSWGEGYLKSKLIEHIEPKHKYLKNLNGHFPDGHPGAEQYQKIYQFLK